MIFLVLTSIGLKGIESFIIPEKHILWLSSGVANSLKIDELRHLGVSVTELNYELDPSELDEIRGVIEQVREHHPGMLIWCESTSVT